MKLSELIKQLEAMKATHGDVPVRVQSLTHTWEPDPVIRPIGAKHDSEKWVLLNP